MNRLVFVFLVVVGLVSCHSEQASTSRSGDYSKSFSVDKNGEKTILRFNSQEYLYSDVENDLRIGTLGNVHLSFLEQLGMLSNVVAAGDMQYFSDSVRGELNSRGVLSIGTSHQPDRERIMESDIDLLFYYDDNFDATPFEKLGIKTVKISEYKEMKPLGRFQWVLVYGFFTGKLSLAEEMYEKKRAEYQANKNQEKNAGLNCLSIAYYSNQWFVAGGESYIANLFNDAGFNYLIKDGVESRPINAEKMSVLLSDCDYVRVIDDKFINNGQLVFPEGQEELFNLTPRLKGAFYCDASKTDYFNRSAISPEDELNDLVHLVSDQNYRSRFYKILSVERD